MAAINLTTVFGTARAAFYGIKEAHTEIRVKLAFLIIFWHNLFPHFSSFIAHRFRYVPLYISHWFWYFSSFIAHWFPYFSSFYRTVIE